MNLNVNDREIVSTHYECRVFVVFEETSHKNTKDSKIMENLIPI